ncbi:MAG TPA: argininosuccinate lyase [Spirochaetota bacterium]|nr:argininosuccinate lyase [Spirochaetota bacterium]HOM38901.1 argininosuccinate lyase [Spirochaetota bacterium]HPQ49120.1 argininosuccinate lyase [Spirochaetota bacterium]
MKKIWAKKGLSLDPFIEKFTVGDDYIIDRYLVTYDIMGSIAHSRMLKKISILSDSEQYSIEKGLKEIYKSYKMGNFTIEYEDEDVHSKIERLLIEKIGESGEKLHTARSRNDQVLTDIRLYTKDNLLDIFSLIIEVVNEIEGFGLEFLNVPMPGYTHMQRAMPSSVGQWAFSFVEEFIDYLIIGQACYKLNDASPLGSGAGFGVSINIDREFTANELGFSRVQINPIACQNSRGKIEASVIDFINLVALVLNRIANDILIFTTSEFSFFEADTNITTGSSIMPQKKNLDVLELIRGRTSIIISNSIAVKSIITNLLSGYNRDLQEVKKILVISFEMIKDFLKAIKIVFSSIRPIEENIIKAFDKYIFATDYAYKKVVEGVPFRRAYREVGESLDNIPIMDPKENILSKNHLGATGNLGIDIIKSRKIDFIDKFLNIEKGKFTQIKRILLGDSYEE